MPHLAFSPGIPELLIILAALVLVFGARKLPELARSMGSSVTQFKKGLKDEPERLEPGSEAAPDSEKDEPSSAS
jgi:sec-independent protein translocase protein TatA